MGVINKPMVNLEFTLVYRLLHNTLLFRDINRKHLSKAFPSEGSRLSSCLFHKLYLLYCHLLVHGLAHVIYGQGCNTYGRQGFHLHPCLACCLYLSPYLHVFLAYMEAYVCPCKKDVVAHWYYIASPFGTHYSSNLGYA